MERSDDLEFSTATSAGLWGSADAPPMPFRCHVVGAVGRSGTRRSYSLGAAAGLSLGVSPLDDARGGRLLEESPAGDLEEAGSSLACSTETSRGRWPRPAPERARRGCLARGTSAATPAARRTLQTAPRHRTGSPDQGVTPITVG